MVRFEENGHFTAEYKGEGFSSTWGEMTEALIEVISVDNEIVNIHRWELSELLKAMMPTDEQIKKLAE